MSLKVGPGPDVEDSATGIGVDSPSGETVFYQEERELNLGVDAGVYDASVALDGVAADHNLRGGTGHPHYAKGVGDFPRSTGTLLGFACSQTHSDDHRWA